MALDDEEKASGAGDGSLTKGSSSPSRPPSPTATSVPDVELIVDGFGFMPKVTTVPSSSPRQSNTFDETNKVIAEIIPEAEEKSPCASSTNIDIVRRYTWKTKNRMIVQVNTLHLLYNAILRNYLL